MAKELKQKLLKHVLFLEGEIADFPRFQRLTQQEYLTDRDRRRSVERWAENIINSVIDIAKVVLSIESIPIPDSYKETVSLLSSIPSLGIADSSRLADWTRFRNLLAHEYVDIRWKSLERFIRESREIHEDFLAMAKRYLKRVMELEGSGCSREISTPPR